MENDPKTAEQARMFANRLAKRYRHLKKWARRTGAGVYRLYDRDIPEVPLLLDVYDDVSGGVNICLSLYKRPYEKDADDEARWLAAMKTAAAAALGITENDVFCRLRERQRGLSQYEKSPLPENRTGVPAAFTVAEGGQRFAVKLSDYLDTGLFPDRRALRALIKSGAAGKSVLNLFCYTASFSVCAAAGGAARTDSVDLSNTYLDWAAENFALNGFAAVKAGAHGGGLQGHVLHRADAAAFVKDAAARRLRWDIVIVDPPTFSNSKKTQDDFDLQRDHGPLVEACLALLNPGGTLYFSANMRRFKPAAVLSCRGEDITETLRGEDFSGRKIPSCWRIST